MCLSTPAACGESQQLKHYGLRYCIMAALLTAVSAELQEVRHTASTSGEITLEGCPDHVSWKDAPFANELEPDVPTYVYWLRALFTPKETTTLVRTLMPASFSTAADSTDLLPSYEVYLLGAGKPADALQHDAARLARARALVLPRIEQCVLPFVRRKFGCPECVPCISLARRYKPTERTQIQSHRDALARVTLVIELQPGDASSPAAAAAAGGLFVKSSDAAAPSFVPMRAGDAFVHDYALLHGMQIN